MIEPQERAANTMHLAVDTAYDDATGRARAAGVLFDTWLDAVAAHEVVVDVDGIAPYEPGAFYKRELPCVRAVVERCPVRPTLIVVDSYVDLAPSRPGLGRHVHEALSLPVVGVAKTSFVGAAAVAVEVLRGASAQPLYVTAVGVDVDEAARHVRAMHGPHRVPTLLKRVDALARGAK